MDYLRKYLGAQQGENRPTGADTVMHIFFNEINMPIKLNMVNVTKRVLFLVGHL